ncbi:GDT1 family protein [Candidatus Methylobacter favarea]|uniref:GDT1 family protein n=1 Tax=Candidatus Methylobacter favarea TaxID=2707345 RepID=A0A8S0WLJ4_9GAMM|nr:TMEM165/GDT1 family protein [Candidatus Methylobacter favarea]CAA9889260.1 GDT1 family protein [Candidatus Methylobacter favarea]
MDNLHFYLQNFLSLLTTGNIREISTTTATSFALIAAAEIGDKSQLVCMTLASRYRALPVMLGAIAAFAFLNTLAVVFGIAIASWLPHYIVAATVSVLFAIFGIHSLRLLGSNGNEVIKEKSGHSIFFATFLLIAMAEFGDKTQLAVVALTSTTVPLAVWLGSTAALTLTSALGIITGRAFIKRISLILLHKISGTIFLILSVFAAYRSYISYPA